MASRSAVANSAAARNAVVSSSSAASSAVGSNVAASSAVVSRAASRSSAAVVSNVVASRAVNRAARTGAAVSRPADATAVAAAAIASAATIRRAEIFDTDDTQDAAQIAAAIAPGTPYEAPTTRLAQARASATSTTTTLRPKLEQALGRGRRRAAEADRAGLGLARRPGDRSDPVSYPLVAGGSAALGEDVVSVVGVRFVVGGRIQWCDAADVDYALGEKLIVDSERGPRLGTVASPPARRATRDRQLRRVLRRAHEGDLQGEREGDAERTRLLRAAKDAAAHLRMPLKVYRVEPTGERGRGGKLNVYYTRPTSASICATSCAISATRPACGSSFASSACATRRRPWAASARAASPCCTTWMPDFVPVSIKMAKDQGLVLSPTKVARRAAA